MESIQVTERIVNRVIKFLIHVICKVDVADMKKITRSGPALLITNHTTNIEGPTLYVHLRPRKTTGLGKIELWQNPLTRFVMKVWGSIPVHRGRVDSVALRACIEALEDGSVLGVAPEGTRSKSGSLKRAHRGAAMLAARTGVPVYPAAQWGFSDIGRNLKRLKRTPVTIRIGPPFTVKLPGDATPSARTLGRIADEMMYQIARILPARFRGVYSDLSKMTTDYLHFLQPQSTPPTR